MIKDNTRRLKLAMLMGARFFHNIRRDETIVLWKDKHIGLDKQTEGDLQILEDTDLRNMDLDGLIPDYENDLNAVREVEEKHIIPLETGCYFYALEDVIGRDLGYGIKSNDGLSFSGWIAFANASQRTQAIIETLDL